MAKFSETSNAKKGGLFVGDSHAEGGIPAIVTDTGQPIEVEGGEAIINKKATALHWEELSKINQSAGGGVPIPPPDDADKVLEKYNQGGKITNKEKKVVFDKWKKLVNMTFTELSRYYHSKEGKESGLSESEAKEQAISTGRESAEWILKMKKTNWKKWTDDMWKWANKQISFISRMSGLQGDLTDEKGKKTRKYKALLIWGNNPKKKNAVSFKTGGTTNIEENNSETTYFIQKRISKYQDITYVIMKRYPYLTGFATDEYNGDVFTDELEAKSKLNYIIAINKKQEEFGLGGSVPSHYSIREDLYENNLQEKLAIQASNHFSKKVTPDYWHFSTQYFNGREITYEVYSEKGGFWVNFQLKNNKLLLSSMKLEPIEKFASGGGIPETSNNYAFVTSTSTTGKRLFKVFDHIPTNKEVYVYYQQVNKKIGTPIEIVDSSISIELLSGFDREKFLKLLNEVALIQFSSKIKDIKELMFSFDSKTFNVYEFEAELNYGRIVKVKMVDGVIFLEDKYEKGGPVNNSSENAEQIAVEQISKHLKNITKSTTSLGLEISIYNKWSDKKYIKLNWIGFDKYIIEEFFIGSGSQINIDWQKNLLKIDKILSDLKNEVKYTKWDIGSIKYTISYKNDIERKIYSLSKLKEAILSTNVIESSLVKMKGDGNDSDIRFETGGVPEYHLGGDMSKHLAPNGNPSNLTHEQWHLVRTPAFKQWFGNWEEDPENSSKVVDINKEPLVVFHGSHSKENFSVFEYRGDSYGFHFGTKQSAQDRLRDLSAEMFYGGNPRILEVFLNIKNPIKLKDYNKQEYEYAEELGKDGVIYENEVEDIGSISYAVFSSNQIKLADGTNTTFDSNNPDIRFETGGAVQKSSPDTYENKLLQIRVIGGENSYYKRINQEWKFLSSKELELLKEGTKHELEHIETIEAFKRKDIPSNIVASFIAFDHINETPDYYKKLEQAIPEKMEQGKKIETNPVVFEETIDFKNNLFDLKIQSVKFEDGKTAYAGDVFWKEILIAGFPAIPERTLEDLKDKMHKIVRETEINANSYSKNIVFINRKSYRVSDDTYYSALQKTPKATLSKDSLRYFLENHQSAGMLASGTDLSKYDDLAILRSIMLKILREEEGIKNEYTIPYNFDELNSLKQQALIEFNTKQGKKIDSEKYTYALTIRPFDIGTYPKQNFIRVVEEAPEYKFGLLEYSEPLDDTAIQHYSLAPVSEILQYDGSMIDYYEGNYAKVKIERDSKNIPSLMVDFYDKETNEKTHSQELSGKQFREKINSGDWKIISEIPKQNKPKEERIKETPMEEDKKIDSKNKDRKYAFELKPTDVILDPVSNTKKAIERTDVFDKYVNLWFTDSTMTRINNTGPHLSKFEVFSSSETTIKNPIKKETQMEQEQESANPTGLVTNNWNEVPIRWKNVKAVRPVTFSINPFDKGLQSIVKVFSGDDTLRPIMSGIRFEEKGLAVTDAHKLLHIAYKHSDFIGNYPSLNSQKAYGKYTSPEDIQKQLNEAKFPNWEAVIPRDSEYVYEIDTLKLYQYCKVAANYVNKTTNQLVFKYENKSIGFNVKFLIDSLEAMMKIQKAPKLYIHLTEPSRAAILSFDKSFSVVSSTYTLLMPVMLSRGESAKYNAISQIYGASDIDLNKSIGCYFDFTDNNIHNANGTIADYKESYGDSGGLPLDIITMMDRFIKIGKTRLPILENVLVDGNGIRVDSLDSRIEIANDWDIPQGIYSISNNALVKSGMNVNVEDFPRITKRVPTSNETFSINADIFKFYIEKAANHISNDDLRPIMNGICFESINSQLSIVSTDAHTLFHADLSKYAINFRHNFSFIIPDIKQILNFCKNIESEEVKFYVDDLNPVNFRIGAGRIHFEGRLEDGKYPNWRAIVPQTFSNQLIFDLKDMYNCLNNEMAKSFSKEVDKNAKNLTIFNQYNKIFISEQQQQDKEQEAKIKEICEIKITKKELTEPSEFNIESNFVLLMPVMNTNGTYFNFNVGKFNNVISTIGKEKVIIYYNTLSSVYIFTSDNLDYKTSDAYKPIKVDKPVSTKTKYVGRPSNREKTMAAIERNPPVALKETKPTFSSEAVKLIPNHQMKVLKSTNFSEMEDVISRLNSVAKVTPKLYGQDGVKDKMIYLHYFYADQDWFVTELDQSTGECFGYADLGYGAELGYMSIPEFVSNGKVELDFYFEPKKWSAIAKPDESAFEKQNKPKLIPAKPTEKERDIEAELNHYRNLLKNIDKPLYKQYNKKNVEKIIAELEDKITPAKPTEKVLGIEYKVGTKGHAKAVAQKKQFEEISKSESGISDDSELKDAVRGLEAFMKTTSDATEKSQLKQAINGLKALLK